MTPTMTLDQPRNLSRHPDLSGRVALVTGGSRGIGRSIVRQLASYGCTVVFTYQSHEEAAHEVEQECAASCVLALKADVRDRDAASRVVETAVSKFGRLDILVNNAGITRDRALLLMTPDDWQAV